ncbi:hypothetical protein PoB_005091800 [Plakobranchus ocellatus]|uniref:Uncharacterized protein n=1 Tax=Plakobranchus ocellatus TaxID=259542 RepID=A0AAV4BXP3_9GAST|nr:hypothetical protein PoB_005091800 [Plakobranchus ocellatus]
MERYTDNEHAKPKEEEPETSFVVLWIAQGVTVECPGCLTLRHTKGKENWPGRPEEWRHVCENLKPSSDPRAAWQFIRSVSDRGNKARVKPLALNGKAISTDRKEADAFTKHFSKIKKVPRDPVADLRMQRLKKAPD